MDIWALGVIMVETYTRRHFLRSEKPDIISQLQSFNEVEIPNDSIDDIQAQHLLLKVLKKNPLDRANIVTVLVRIFIILAFLLALNVIVLAVVFTKTLKFKCCSHCSAIHICAVEWTHNN
jgi:serine/threonine protein kinase